MKILLISRFNVPNLGDIAISNQLYKIVSEFGEVHKYNLFGAPYTFKDVNKVTSKRDIKKTKIINTLTRYKFDFIVNFYKKFKNITSRKKNDKLELENIITNYDYVIIGGGNMLMSLDENISTLKRLEEYLNITTQSNIPTLFFSIGIGPFFNPNHRDKAIGILNKSNYVSFRDKSSYDLFVNNGGKKSIAQKTVDPVFYYKNENKVSVSNHSEFTIGINVIDSRLIGELDNRNDYYIKGYSKLVSEILKQTQSNIVLFTTSVEDSETLENVYKDFADNKKVKAINAMGLKDLDDIYKTVDILIGSRMHSMIIAYTYLVPIIGISWQEKINALFRIIDAEEELHDFNSLLDNTDDITQSVINQMNNISQVRDDMAIKLKHIREIGNVDRKILKEMENHQL